MRSERDKACFRIRRASAAPVNLPGWTIAGNKGGAFTLSWNRYPCLITLLEEPQQQERQQQGPQRLHRGKHQ